MNNQLKETHRLLVPGMVKCHGVGVRSKLENLINTIHLKIIYLLYSFPIGYLSTLIWIQIQVLDK